MTKDPKKVAMGKKSRAQGADFERRTRKDLEEKGWIVDKWSNNVELSVKEECISILGIGKDVTINSGKLIPAKRKYAGPGRPMAIGTGFPDFVCFKPSDYGAIIVDDATPEVLSRLSDVIRSAMDLNEPIIANRNISMETLQEVIGVECKTNGYLDKEEKQKCRWLIDNKIFTRILIARKTKVKNKIVIVYDDFETKYGEKNANI